ncbi:hypothetical protein FHL15_009675 [Xylaria flabelliformis]|uniref:2EXR domain-containing protein n=1 Tax=Xylaria flabelliformis TaxID=2512241 RepID=A0A553HN84_9PEZI|nr:hypothetical protein FHL15_009675 [Xylaria flabelliformis]
MWRRPVPYEKQTLNGLYGAADVVSQPKDAETCFTCFSKLPPEIRHIIWELAIPGRVLNISHISIPPGHLTVGPWYPAPPVAHVCYESRQLAQRMGIINNFGTMQIDREGADLKSLRHSTSWFDSHRDTLRLHDQTAIKYIPRSVENIVFCHLSLLINDRGMDMNLAALPKLRRVQFEMDWRFLPSKIWHTWEFAQGRARVGSILLDVDDETEVRRFENTLQHGPKWLRSYWLEEIGHLRREKFRQRKAEKGEDWKVVQKQLQDEWMAHRKANIDSATGHSKSESYCSKMPEFRRVLTLVPFPEDRYKEGVAFYGKHRFLLFDITKKPGRRVLQFELQRSMLYLESAI